MEEKEINPAESLQLINSMISTAKNRLADDGVLIVFWGWLVIVAAMFNYICIRMNVEWGGAAWLILMPLGGIFSMVYGYRQNKKEKVKTYIDKYLKYLWIGFGVSLAITLGFMPFHGVKSSYFFLMLLYGLATMVSGGLLNFRPLIIGSLFAFACAVISVFLSDTDQLLCISAALLCSYVIPGHLLRSRYKSQHV
ncbi:MAG: hypothetical protein JST26_06285 [Bacteroidetes bacterium]|nr:hypothetical protein [Bacteroidota bacterium]